MQPAFFVLRMNYTLQISGCQGFLGYFFHFRVEFSAMIRYNRPMDLKKLLQLALLTGVSMILFLVEAQIPPLVPVPGVKLGLPNIAVVFALYRLRTRTASAISLLRVALAALLFGSVLSLAYSAAGAVCSFAVMWLLRRSGRFGCTGVSVAGAVVHNLAQIAAAALLLETASLTWYIPVLCLSGTIAGVCIGLLSALLIERIPKR